MLALLAAMAVNVSASCPALDPADVVKARAVVALGGKRYEAVSSSHPGDGELGYASSRVTLFGKGCAVAFDRKIDDPLVLTSQVRLAGEPLVIVTSSGFGGSACNYDSFILTGRRSVHPLKTEFGTDNMGGFHVGNLGSGRGLGLIVWDAAWDDGAHYSPHRYTVMTYAWKNGQFGKPMTTKTKQKFDPAPDNVAKGMGWPFRDDTRQERFNGGC